MTTIITHALAFLVGAGVGAWAWTKYKAKLAADLVTIAK